MPIIQRFEEVGRLLCSEDEQQENYEAAKADYVSNHWVSGDSKLSQSDIEKRNKLLWDKDYPDGLDSWGNGSREHKNRSLTTVGLNKFINQFNALVDYVNTLEPIIEEWRRGNSMAKTDELLERLRGAAGDN